MAPETTHVDERGSVADDGATDQGDARTQAAGAVPVERALADPDRLAHVERALLEARVAALERTVEHKDRQLQEIVDRYEQVLDERERARHDDRDRAVEGVEITFEDQHDEGRLALFARWVRSRLERLGT